jgi:hypothetical protein
MMGFPEDWSRIDKWIYHTPELKTYSIEPQKNKVLCPDLPILHSYIGTPPDSYWSQFPKCDLLTSIQCDIDIEELSRRILKNEEVLSEAELNRAKVCLADLLEGVSSFQRTELPPVLVDNGANIDKYGREVADTIASWVRKGFAAGPFKEPPVKDFRVNRLLAIQQNEKVWPMLDLSTPDGVSFNDAVQEEKLEKVVMSSATRFGKSLYEAGKHSSFSKFDFVDAYKNVPVKLYDLRLQGFA